MDNTDFQKAWLRLIKEINRKTSWGKTELSLLMLACISDPEDKHSETGEFINAVVKVKPKE